MATSPKYKNTTNITSKLTNKRNVSIVLIAIIAAFGAWRVFLSGASPNNCQPEKSVNICDIDQVQGNTDNILSNGPEAQDLNKKDPGTWPLYFGTAFRAPSTSLDGAQPVYRVYNNSVTWHDYMFDASAKSKQAQNPGAVVIEGIAFYAWPDASRTGTVPVYRLSQGGSTTKVIFTTDRAWRDKLVAADVNNSNGWKDGGIPFYAFPPTYQAVGADGKATANPYDCSKQENFISERCTAQRNNLNAAIANGSISASNDCPATLEAYIKEPFPSRFPQACQDKWNKEASNCSIRENFISERCIDARAAFERAEQERIARETAARNAANNGSGSSYRRSVSSSGSSGSSGSTESSAGGISPSAGATAVADARTRSTSSGASSLVVGFGIGAYNFGNKVASTVRGIASIPGKAYNTAKFGASVAANTIIKKGTGLAGKVIGWFR
jgi:hypothetical protein